MSKAVSPWLLSAALAVSLGAQSPTPAVALPITPAKVVAGPSPIEHVWYRPYRHYGFYGYHHHRGGAAIAGLALGLFGAAALAATGPRCGWYGYPYGCYGYAYPAYYPYWGYHRIHYGYPYWGYRRIRYGYPYWAYRHTHWGPGHWGHRAFWGRQHVFYGGGHWRHRH